MTEISIHELYRFYLDTIAHCSSAILDKSDDEIAYDLFEEFDVGAHSFLHDDSLTKLQRAGYLPADVVSLSRRLRTMWLALQNQNWSMAEIRTHSSWKELFALGDEIRQRLGIE